MKQGKLLRISLLVVAWTAVPFKFGDRLRDERSKCVGLVNSTPALVDDTNSSFEL